MPRYTEETKSNAISLRSKGYTYSEINIELHQKITKSTLSLWCSNCELPSSYQTRIKKIIQTNITKARTKAFEKRKLLRAAMFASLKENNIPVANQIHEINTAKIALAMLCLGEASKYKAGKHTNFYFGNSDPKIISIYLKLLHKCFKIDPNKIRCTVQCRADQNTEELKQYWMSITNIPNNLFYKPLIDPRTIGKPTENNNYKGVLRIDYLDSKIQHELETIAVLVYNNLNHTGR